MLVHKQMEIVLVNINKTNIHGLLHYDNDNDSERHDESMCLYMACCMYVQSYIIIYNNIHYGYLSCLYFTI